MARVTLLGVQELDFQANDGKDIKGIKLHVCFPDEFVSGQKVDTKFISDSSCRHLHISSAELDGFIGKQIEISTNFNGKLLGISLSEEM